MPHSTEIAIRFYELDPYNHLNHSAYIQYFETARIELLGAAGFELQSMMEDGVMIVVTEIATKFLSSATSGDVVTVETEVVEFKRVTSTWRQRILRAGEVIATQELRAALVNLDGRPIRFPEEMIAALEPFRAQV